MGERVHLSNEKKIKAQDCIIKAGDKNKVSIKLQDNNLNFLSFSLEPGKKVQQHDHGERRIIFVRSGTAKIKIKGDEATVSAGDVIAFPVGIDHSLEVTGKDRIHLIEAIIPTSSADAKKKSTAKKDGEVSIYENAVLGDKDLQKRLMKIDPEFGDFCIRASGEIFGKPLLDQRTKAIIAIAVDVVEQLTGIPFKNHVDIALKQGVTPEELKELILLMTIYAGFNKAGSFFGELKRVLAEREKK